jgi:hypothetical protein
MLRGPTHQGRGVGSIRESSLILTVDRSPPNTTIAASGDEFP